MSFDFSECRPMYIERREWLGRPEYWALHVRSFLLGYGGLLEEEQIWAAFGLSADAVEAFYAREFAEEEFGEAEYACYRIALPLPQDGLVAMEYHQFADDAQTLCQLVRARGGESVEIGHYDGQSWHPRIPWADLWDLADRVGLVTEDATLRNAAIPLFVPTVFWSRGDDVEQIWERLRQAWIRLGVLPPAHTDAVVEALVAESQGLSRHLWPHG